MKNKTIALLFVMFMGILLFAGCGRKEKEKVSLTLWTPLLEETLTKDAIKKFIRIHKNEAEFDIKIKTEEIEDAKKKLMKSPKKSADIFHFASDQYTDLKSAGIFASVNHETEKAARESGGNSASIVDAVSEYSKLFAYPSTNSNGYFLYYNKKYFSAEDVASLDRILEIAAKENKYFAMDWASGWYLYSFFSAAEKTIEINTGGTANTCNFNGTDGNYTGLDVASSMLNIARHPGFQHVPSESLLETMEKRDIIAVVNGTWNAQQFADLWGKDCGATKLPTYTVNSSQLQMGSFAGYKYIGVNSNTKYKKWASMVARWLTTYKYQMIRYQTTGECPANLEAANSHKVQISAPIAALNQQNKYATMQNVLESYWEPMEQFGKAMVSDEIKKEDLQNLLDKTVQEIQAPLKE